MPSLQKPQQIKLQKLKYIKKIIQPQQHGTCLQLNLNLVLCDWEAQVLMALLNSLQLSVMCSGDAWLLLWEMGQLLSSSSGNSQSDVCCLLTFPCPPSIDMFYCTNKSFLCLLHFRMSVLLTEGALCFIFPLFS